MMILMLVLMALKAESGSCQNIIDNLHFCVWVPGIIVAQSVIIPGKLLLFFLRNCCFQKIVGCFPYAN